MTRLPSLLSPVLGAVEAVEDGGDGVNFDAWYDEVTTDISDRVRGTEEVLILADLGYAAHVYLQRTNGPVRARKDVEVQKKRTRNKRSKRPAGGRTGRPSARTTAADRVPLPTTRRAPTVNWRSYAYLITGEKKIGKTSFAIAGAEELVIQFDKPQIAYAIQEVVPHKWQDVKDVVSQLETLAAEDPASFPYDRIVIDGAGESYQMCQEWACKKLGVGHPSDAEWGKGWSLLREEYTAFVNAVLKLQSSAGCGAMFIAHSEWREKRVRGQEQSVSQLVPNLPSRCEEILNGKVDAYFTYDYHGEARVLTLLGDESVAAGHRMNGMFMTPGGERVREVYMGNSPEEAMTNFIAAFNNEQPVATYKELKPVRTGASTSKSSRARSRKRTTK